MSDISYAQIGDTHIAYKVLGRPRHVDIVMVSGAFFPFELLEDDRVAARFMQGLAALGRLVVFDKRGVGLSDPLTDWSRSIQEQWAEDLLAVTDAAALDCPVVVSWEENGTARRAVTMRPGLFTAMVLVNPSPSTQRFSRLVDASGEHGVPTRTIEEMAFPSRIHDPEFTAWLMRSGRAGASPTSASRIWGRLLAHPGSLTPESIATRTLVLHNRDNMHTEEEVREVAEAIEGATFVQVAGTDAYPIAGDVDLLIREIVEFVTGEPAELVPQRQLAAVLLTDLVESTQRAVADGDAQWRDLLDVHDRAVQACVRVHGGRVVKYTGDGALALMPSATSALESVRALREHLAARGLRIRAGIHVGDVDVRGDDVSGLAVNIAARIMSRAGADETVVSEAAREAMLGSKHRFEETETVELKGIPGTWTLYRRQG